MKTKQSARRLAALTLATAVTIPQVSPAFAASPGIGKTGMARLEMAKLSTASDKKIETGRKDRFPLLTLSTSFQQKISKATSVIEFGSGGRDPTFPVKTDVTEKSDQLTPSVTTGLGENNSDPELIFKSQMAAAILTTGLDEKISQQISVSGSPPETDGLTLPAEENTGGGETAIDNSGPVGTERVTGVTEQQPDGENASLFGSVVMPPEAGKEAPEENGTGEEGPAKEISDKGGGQKGEAGPDEAGTGPGADAVEVAKTTGTEEVSLIEAASSQAIQPFAGPPPGDWRLRNYVIGFGLKVSTDPFGKYVRLRDYDERFQVEFESPTAERSDYGAREYSGGIYDGPLTGQDLTLYYEEAAKGFMYAIFPSEEMLGRVPDRTFAGWYIYPKGEKAGATKTAAKGWTYGDTNPDRMQPVDLREYEDGCLDYDDCPGAYNVDNLVLGHQWDYGQRYSYGTLSTGMPDTANPVSFVGRWVASDESRAADVTRIKDTATNEDGSLKSLESAVTLSVGGDRLQLYSKDILGLYGDDLKDLETTFARGDKIGDVSEYWLRVGAGVNSLDLEFNAAEIFYDYNHDKSGKSSPVRITWSYGGGESLDYTAGEGTDSVFTSRMLPEPDAGNHGVNSWDNPAYSRWSVTNIALTPTSLTQNGQCRYNDITITVTPPSVYEKQQKGEALTDEDQAKLTTYIFHVQRLTEPTLKQEPGNTPMGMIQRDTGLDAAAKEKAAGIFKAGLQFSSNYGEYPRSQENNGGALFWDKYSANAWKAWSENVDLDPEAIVVYLDSAFQDPGITLTDAEGRTVTIAEGNAWRVYRRLELKTAEELSVTNLTKGSRCWYKDHGLMDETAGEVLTGDAVKDQIDLRGLKVLPGIYTMEYELIDPVAGKTYDSTGTSFVTEDGNAGAKNFKRTVVVLPLPGDVDMDGAVTSADAEILRKNLIDATSDVSARLGGEYLGQKAAVDLFAYRVANVNHDSKNNAYDVLDKTIQNSIDPDQKSDVDTLEALPKAQLKNVSSTGTWSDYYYIPLPSEVEPVTRLPLTTNASAEGAKVELMYLGKEAPRELNEDAGSGDYGNGYIKDTPLGPWRENGAWKTDKNSTEEIELFDTLWVGVKLSDSAANELLKDKSVDTFTFSLVYDVRYLKPTEVLTKNQWDDLTDKTPEGRWAATLERYNLGAGSRTVWGADYTYKFTRALQSGQSFDTYNSKAITPLEVAALNEGRTSHLRELVFSVTLRDATDTAAVKARLDQEGDQWLLAVPFILVQHPVGQNTYQGVEMQAGMSDFTLLLENGENGKTTTAAYDPAGKDIFGGNTVNLATSVTYANAGPEIPLGKDKSKVYYIRSEAIPGTTSRVSDVVYSTEFKAQIGWEKDENDQWVFGKGKGVLIPSGKIIRNAPDWLRYDLTTGIISGKPPVVDTYTFTVAEYRFVLEVKQADLHYWAVSQDSYYGEYEFRGTNSADFIFRYAADDIRSQDRERAEKSGGTIAVDGIGANLGALLDDEEYREPGFTAVDENGQAVTIYTPASDSAYSIEATTPALSANYNLIYSPSMAEGIRKGFTIHQRPFLVKQLLVENVGTVYSDSFGLLFNREAVLENRELGSTEFSVRLVDSRLDDEVGHYEGLPLSGYDYEGGVLLPGDSLVLQYTAELLQTGEDKEWFNQGGVGRYQLNAPEEERAASISDLIIVGGKNSDNYVLKNVKPESDEGVVGTVRRRNVIGFRFKQVPFLDRMVGNQLDGTQLRFNILREGDAEEGTYVYNENTTAQRFNIRFTWATQEEKDNNQEGSLLFQDGQKYTMDYDGRYLCMATDTGINENGEIVSLKVYYDKPLKITPLPLTLTAVPTSRFYGEENGQLRFTYKPSQLTNEDQNRLRQLYGDRAASVPERDGEELKEILVGAGGTYEGYYTPPTLTAVDDVDTRLPLDKDSRYTGSNTNVVLIEGAWCKNYAFNYTYTNQGTDVVQEDWGASSFKIEKRLIVVEALRLTENTRNLTTIYADTRRLSVSDLTLSAEDVLLTLPEHDEKSTRYYLRGNAANTFSVNIGYGEGVDNAVIGGDEISFTYTATMVSQDGENYARWTDFAKGYFDMSSADENGDRIYPVQMNNLAMVGADANNYQLVFKNSQSALLGTTARWRAKLNCINPGTDAKGIRYVPKLVEVDPDGSVREIGEGEGTVTLRPIKSIEILSVGKMDYIYGEPYFPEQSVGGFNGGMRLRIQYETEYENYPEGNVSGGTLYFQVSRYDENGLPVTTFDGRGLNIYYQDGEEYTPVDESRKLSYRQPLSPDPHDGVYLVVAGKRGNQTELVQSNVYKAATLTVRRRTLTLKADDHRRIYGEANPGVFTYTFSADELAGVDQAKLGAANGRLDSGELAKLGLNYKAPVYKTQAGPRSNVLNGGRSGYEIYVDAAGAGSLDNYELIYEPGTLYVYPRMVYVDQFYKDPIYTIYSDLSDRIVSTNVFAGGGDNDFSLWLPLGQYIPAADVGALPMTGPALVAGDTITLGIEVHYPANIDLYGGEQKTGVTVQDAWLLAGTREYDNYVLGKVNGKAAIREKNATGSIELRSIGKIEIIRAPYKLEYTYGEALDLDGLVVSISYQVGDNEANTKSELVFYRQTATFAEKGLYVNYYPSPTILPKDNKLEEREKLRGKYYTASTGDHLTIAPTHASMDERLTDGDPKKNFAANGQYLVISAQRDSSQYPAEPTLVTDVYGVPLQIKVNPKPVEFTLEAESKTYDGTTQAAGTLTIGNAYQKAGYVDAYNQNVTDMVYPVTGADYEALWGNKLTQEGDRDFSDYVARNGYSFSTGSYRLTGSISLGEENITWQPGYQYASPATMTFSFLDPNVAYEEEPDTHDVYGPLTSKPVQVTGLRLAGADAMNYVLRTDRVTEEHRGAESYKGGALPRATVYKANRAIGTQVLPLVEVDPNTNVVRVLYDQTLSDIVGGEEDKYLHELHFESALQYDATERPEPEVPTDPDAPALPDDLEIQGQADELTTLVVGQWAGSSGQQLWWDNWYYGGEAVKLEYPVDYRPLEEDIPQEEETDDDDEAIRKGQTYRWAGYDEDFALDVDAYPDASGEPWPGYDLYKTDRLSLARDRVYWPVVRVAETHNYYASPAISSVKEYTSDMIGSVVEAIETLEYSPTDDAREAMDRAASAALAVMAGADAEARAAAELEKLTMAEIAESGQWLEEWEERPAAAAVKTYAQRLELISVKELEGEALPTPPEEEGETPDTPARAAANEKLLYLVPTLEAVWFTDVLEYADREALDAVVRNMSPLRYYDYAWDSALTAPLFPADSEGLSLADSFLVEITLKDEEDKEITAQLPVNVEHVARIYVDLTAPSSGGWIKVDVKELYIDSEDLTVVIGAEPVRLRAVIEPKEATNRGIRWSSSDKSVATVDKNGLVTFVGVGVAVITATSVDGPSDSITVTVLEVEGQVKSFPNGIFDADMAKAFFDMDQKELLFHPGWEMTRGETAQLLVRFYQENPNWTRKGPEDFSDLTGKESYAQAARLLGREGVFLGLPDGGFGGDQTITRAEFVVLLIRMLGVDVSDTTGMSHAFRDTGEEDTWAYREIDATKNIPGVVLGVGEGYFAPARGITRAEAVTFLHRLLQFPQVGESPVIPGDVGESHWARNAILRAVNQGMTP